MSYRALVVGAAASLLGVGMLLLNVVAGPVEVLDMGSRGEISSDQGEYSMVALALIVVGAVAAVASLIAARDDPDRPGWVGVVSAALVIVAVIAVILFALAIAFIVLLCRDGCN